MIKFYGIKSKIVEKVDASELVIGDSKGLSIEFNKVSFSYQNEAVGKIVEIKELDLKVE